MKNRILRRSALVTALFLTGVLAAQPAWSQGDLDPSAKTSTGTAADVALKVVEANRAEIIDEILRDFSSATEDNGRQLAIALELADDSTLNAAYDAASLKELSALLLGEAPTAVGDLTQDYSFTPVTPCRIVDTRLAGGVFAPGEEREYYVYGYVADQGGNAAGCTSPVGEPRGVAVNITTVGVSGQGNVVGYPSNEAAPNSSIVNYKTGVQNVANAAAIKTYNFIGPPELAITNRNGVVHVIIDVLGYYNAPVLPVGVEYASSTASTALTATDVTVESIAVTVPKTSYCAINASGYFGFAGTGKDGARCSITTGTTVDFDALIIASDNVNDGDAYHHFAATKGYTQAAGVTTYNLVCENWLGTTRVARPHMTAVCSDRRY